jgi:hypothetical protein
MVDFSFVDSLIRNYATPVVGAALILAGVFLRVLGKGISYLVLGLGIIATLYIGLRSPGTPIGTWSVPAVFLAGIAASVVLALALRALTVAFEFGFFVVGWFLLLQAVPAFLSGFPALSTIPGVSAWMGTSILSTVLAEGAMRRLAKSRRLRVAAPAAIAGALRGARP